MNDGSWDSVDAEIARRMRAIVQKQDQACTGKARFVDRAQAVPVALRITKQRKEESKPYLCPHCHCWHVGSTKWRPARRR